MLKNQANTANVYKGFMQPGKGGCGRILFRGGRTHHHRGFSKMFCYNIADLPGKFLRHLLAQEQVSYPERCVPDFLPAHVRKILAVQLELDFFLKAALAYKMSIGVSGDTKGCRHP